MKKEKYSVSKNCKKNDTSFSSSEDNQPSIENELYDMWLFSKKIQSKSEKDQRESQKNKFKD